MKILHLEDDAGDAELVRHFLAADWPDCVINVVSSQDAFCKALTEGGYDIVLSDFQLPTFNGLEALQLVQKLTPGIPFIFFSGTIGEERAVEAVRAGADDYVLKDRMKRLPLSIQRVIRERAERQARRQREEAFAQEQSLLRMLMENLPDYVYFKDVDSRYLAVSRSLASRYRLTPTDLKGMTDFDVFSEEHARQALEDEQRIIRTGLPLVDVEEKETWPDQSVTWVLTTKVPLRDAAGNIVGTFGVSRDITARKEAEQRVREQAEVIDQTPIAIIITDLAHRVTYCNAGAVGLYGIPRDELLGCTAEDLFTPETLEPLRRARQATFSTGWWTGEVPLTTKAGRLIQVEFHMSLIYDDTGHPKSRLSIALDVTEKKKLEEKYLRAQRLESLGMLASGIAHDLNNVLAPVLMGAPLLRSRNVNLSDLQVLETIENSAVRGAGLVRQILSFAHGTGGEKTLIQVKHLLREIVELIQETFPKSIVLEDEIPGDLWTVRGNPTQLQQVLLNLCVNARDAMPQSGTLTLRAENRMVEKRALQAHPGAMRGPYLVIEVTDTGTGIPAGVLAHIWDPFFTTKGEGKGTGLGLATVRGIAASHGGFVEVATKSGEGSTFSVFLPAAEQSDAVGSAAASAHPFLMRGQGELVLVVDDEVGIRDMITAILSQFGYRVVTAANGVEAMSLYAPRVSEFSLVITDLSMPEMGGGSLSLALARLNPTVKILFITGAGMVESVGETIAASSRLLRKPFTAEKLLSCVHEALATPSAPAQG